MAKKPALRRAVPNSKIKAADYNFNFDQLNDYIEGGIADNAIGNYEADREFRKGQWVLAKVDGEYGLYESLYDGNKGNSLTDGEYWKKVNLGGGAYVGMTVFSLDPLVEDGLHLLDGEELPVGGIYDQFINAYIAKLHQKAPQRFCSEEEWQASVEQYGVCGKYVYTEGVSVRLPKVTGHIEGTLDPNALGDLVEAGLPNIIGSVNNVAVIGNNAGTGALKYTRTGACSADGSNHNQGTLSINASDSNSIYGNSNTVQTQSILGYMYIVVATGTKTDVEVNIDNFVTDLNQKVDKSSMVEVPLMTMPDYSAIITGIASPYTAPCNGFIIWSNAGSANCTVNGVTVPVGGNDTYNEGFVTLPLSKGDVITFSKDSGTPCFVPMKGVI